MTKLLVSLCMIYSVAPLFAQFETGEVLGTIRDQKGLAISKAAVSLQNLDTGITVRSTSDDGGNYDFPQVKPGRYSVTAESTGFSKAVASDVRVDVNARQRVELTLQVGQVSEVVEVTGAAATVPPAFGGRHHRKRRGGPDVDSRPAPHQS